MTHVYTYNIPFGVYARISSEIIQFFSVYLVHRYKVVDRYANNECMYAVHLVKLCSHFGGLEKGDFRMTQDEV